MAERHPEVLIDGLTFPEGPRWHEGRLWFSDMHAGEVVAVDVNGNRETIVAVEHAPSGLGWLPDGRLLVVSMHDRKVLRLESVDPPTLVEHADLSGVADFHCNDMVVDAHGRAYVGNFGFDLYGGAAPNATTVALVTPDGDVRAVAEDMIFPNGSVIFPDGRTLVVAESGGLRLTAFDVADDGGLSNRRVWADVGAPPDGICLDAEGCIWVAVPMVPGSFLRIAEGGDVKERIELDDHGAFACMLGGDDGRTLFLLEAKDGNPASSQRGDGRIRTVRVDVPHAGLP